MSVYTSVSRSELQAFLASYTLGELVDYAGIPSGIENTNYYVTTSQGAYVLTIFEKLRPSDIPFFLELMAFFAEHQLPCAHPMRATSGQYLTTLKAKPAALVLRLRGHSLERPSAGQCTAVGMLLARMHCAGRGFDQQRENERGPRWWREVAGTLMRHLAPDEQILLQAELKFQSYHRFADLPRGVIHADLFRDNVLFENDRLSGVIDFYYACTDVLLLDVAVAVNDWCSDENGALNQALCTAFLAAYHAERPLSALERGAWPAALRAAALRFWLSRLQDLHFPRAGEITHIKDPAVFRRILSNRVNDEYYVRSLWPDTLRQADHG